MLSKLKKISARINPFGGINFVIHALRAAGIPQLIDGVLGKRVKQATYSYSDVIMSWICANLCGAERLEDAAHLKQYFTDIPACKFPSSDRIAGVFKKLAADNCSTTAAQNPKSKKCHTYQHNQNAPLGELLLSTIKRLRLLPTAADHTLDYDNTLIACEKFDSKNTYEGYRGYSPAVGFIGRFPVFVEGRDGNTPAKYRMADTVRTCIDRLAAHGYKVKRFRSDAAAYIGDLMEMLDEREIEFFIRTENSAKLYEECIPVGQWPVVEIAGKREAVISVPYTITGKKKEFRVVLTVCLDWDTKNGHAVTGLKHPLRCIITNNWKMTDKQVVEFYNARGDMERNFCSLKNDFNWSRLPFSFLNENTAFLLISAVVSVLFEYILRTFSKVKGMIETGVRLKRFIFSVISVAAWWTGRDGDELVICSEKPFHELMNVQWPPGEPDGPANLFH